MAQERLTLDRMRELVAQLEPVMESFDGSFVELQDEAVALCKRLEREFVSDISSIEALLLAALVNRLKYHMRHREIEMRNRA